MAKLKRNPALIKKRSGFRHIHLDRLVVQVDSDSDPSVQYEVSYDRYDQPWTCTCPHFQYRKQVCKHIKDIMRRFITDTDTGESLVTDPVGDRQDSHTQSQ